MSENSIEIYCDGACRGNGRKTNVGGWGAVIRQGTLTHTISGGERNTSNQRMELTACIKGLEALNGKGVGVDIYSDSAYLVNCFRQRWHVKWQQNGWLNSFKKPVENQDLWRRLLALVAQRRVSFHKVSGHSGNALNEMADRLARMAAENMG